MRMFFFFIIIIIIIRFGISRGISLRCILAKRSSSLVVVVVVVEGNAMAEEDG
jgi:hypothetical protein